MMNSIDSIVHILKLRLILSRQTILAQRPNLLAEKWKYVRWVPGQTALIPMNKAAQEKKCFMNNVHKAFSKQSRTSLCSIGSQYRTYF